MKKARVFKILLAVVLAAGIGMYFFIDGFIPYKIQKTVMPPLKLIEYYTNREFPPETEVVNVEFEYYEESPSEEALEAILEVP